MNSLAIFTAAALFAAPTVQAAPDASAASSPTSTATLTVVFEGIEHRSGAIMFQVFDGAEAYGGKGAPVRAEMLKVDGPSAQATFSGLPAGRYAIRAMHDVDGDGTLATNPFGVPVEPFAFSNNAPAQGGPAKWDVASFDVGPGANVHRITIR